MEGGRAARSVLHLPPGPLTDAGVGIAAQLVGGLAFTPADVIRERVQAGPALAASSSPSPAMAAAAATPRAALKAALAAGGVRGLWKGYWATNVVWLPWGALFFVGYGWLTAAAAGEDERWGGDGGVGGGGGGGGAPTSPSSAASTLPAPTLAACAAAAAGGAALLTHPLDVVKTRLQVLSGPGGVAGLSARSAAASLWRAGGPRAFAAGGTARVAQLSIATALQWVTYEKARAWVDL